MNRQSAQPSTSRVQPSTTSGQASTTSGQVSTIDEKCSICQEEIDADSTIITCGHRFCTTCINEWMLISNACPICRLAIDRNLPLVNVQDPGIFDPTNPDDEHYDPNAPVYSDEEEAYSDDEGDDSEEVGYSDEEMRPGAPPADEASLLQDYTAYIHEVQNVDHDVELFVSSYFHNSGVEVTFYSNDETVTRVTKETLNDFEWHIEYDHLSRYPFIPEEWWNYYVKDNYNVVVGRYCVGHIFEMLRVPNSRLNVRFVGGHPTNDIFLCTCHTLFTHDEDYKKHLGAWHNMFE